MYGSSALAVGSLPPLCARNKQLAVWVGEALVTRLFRCDAPLPFRFLSTGEELLSNLEVKVKSAVLQVMAP